MSEHTLAPILCLPAAGLAEAEEQLRTGLTTNGGGGAPVSALRILNLFLQRLGCDFQVLNRRLSHHRQRHLTVYKPCLVSSAQGAVVIDAWIDVQRVDQGCATLRVLGAAAKCLRRACDSC